MEARFVPDVLSRIHFKHDLTPSTCPLFVDDTRWRARKGARISMPQTSKDFTNYGWSFEASLPVGSFSLSLARVSVFTKLRGILVNGGQRSRRNQDLFGGLGLLHDVPRGVHCGKPQECVRASLRAHIA
ncbi:hypothetical protein Tco_0713374 [Tanacetum coccineum]